MSKEFILQGFRTELFELREDGLISVGGKILPQSIAFSNIRVGEDGMVEKEAGEGGAFRIKSPSGFFEASFRNGQWKVRSDIPEVVKKVEEAMRGVGERTHSAANTATPVPGIFPMSQTRTAARPPTLFGVMCLVVVIAIVLALGYFTFEEPIGRMIEAQRLRTEIRSKEAETRLVEARGKEAYRTLESAVKSVSATASQKLSRLQSASQSLASSIRESTGISLASISRDPEQTPREVDQLLRKDEQFLGAWNDLLNAYTSDEQIGEYRGQLLGVDARIQKTVLEDEDRLRVERITSEVDMRLQAVNNIATSLATVQETLASKRLQEKMSQKARNTP